MDSSRRIKLPDAIAEGAHFERPWNGLTAEIYGHMEPYLTAKQRKHETPKPLPPITGRHYLKPGLRDPNGDDDGTQQL